MNIIHQFTCSRVYFIPVASMDVADLEIEAHLLCLKFDQAVTKAETNKNVEFQIKIRSWGIRVYFKVWQKITTKTLFEVQFQIWGPSQLLELETFLKALQREWTKGFCDLD